MNKIPMLEKFAEFILSQGIDRDKIKNCSLGAPLVWKKEKGQWKTTTIQEFIGKHKE